MATTLPDREGKSEYRAPRLQLSLADFDLERRLGEGSYAQVVQVRQKLTGVHYALKVVDKNLILRNNCTGYIQTERKLLDRLDSPWIVNLYFTFQDAHSLYFVLEMCPNGELHDQLERNGKLSLEDAKFYAAEIVEILEYLREQKVIHRDLKPENLLLDEQGHLKLIDFGSAKDLNADSVTEQQPSRRNSLHKSQRSSSMVLRNEATSFAADLWALGCLLYRMLLASTPFMAASEYLIFQRITSNDLRVPDTLAPAAQDLLRQLLDSDPRNRIGARGKGLAELKGHAFFEGIPWGSLRKQKAPAVKPPADREENDNVDWEWSSLAAALPVYVSSEWASSGLQPAAHCTARRENGHSAVSQQQQAPHISQSAAAKPQQPAGASDKLPNQSAPLPGSTSESKVSLQQQDGLHDSSSGACPKQQVCACAPGMATPGAGSIHGKNNSLKKPAAPVNALAAASQHNKSVQGGPSTSPQSPQKPSDAPSSTGSHGKLQGPVLSPKADAPKPSAGTPHPSVHQKGSNPQKPTTAPSRRGDFSAHHGNAAALQAAWNGSSGRDDRMDQAAGYILMNQYFAQAGAHADGRS